MSNSGCLCENVAALRYNDWKITFLRQNAHGMHVWQAPYEQLRMPMVGNLRTDPFERAHKEAIGYGKWQFEHMFAFAPAGAYVGEWLQSFKEFPPGVKRRLEDLFLSRNAPRHFLVRQCRVRSSSGGRTRILHAR